MGKKHIPVLVYGTLRPGGTDTKLIQGRMVSLGGFPGVKLGKGAGEAPVDENEPFFVAERVMVDEEQLEALDRYEGEGSLYHRRKLPSGEYIYEYGYDLDGYEEVPKGDWLAYTGGSDGGAAKAYGLVE